jgi:hypothetical protein
VAILVVGAWAVLGRYLLRRPTGERAALGAHLAVALKVVVGVVAGAVAVAYPFPGWWWPLVPLGAAGLRLALRAPSAKSDEDSRRPGGAEERAPWWAAALGAGLTGLAATLAWYWVDHGFDRGTGGQVSRLAPVLAGCIAAAAVVAVLVAAVGRVVLQPRRARLGGLGVVILATLAGVVAGMVVLWGLWRLLEDVAGDGLGTATAVWGVVLAALLLVYVFVDQKQWSPHLLYKARLARTFSMSLDADGRASSLPYRVVTTLSTWAARPPTGPQLLIGAAAYQSVGLGRGELAAWPFVFGSDYVGGADVGWTRTVDFEAALGRHNLPDGTLQAAMAISGAAVSPAIGQTNLRSANAVVAAANARLGVWLPSPRYVEDLKTGGFGAPTWLRLRRFTYLLKEIAGSYDLEDRFVYVTDGGQVDNLGLLELLARRCDPVIAFDASGDLGPGKDLVTATFDEVRELARRRLGILFSTPGGQPDGRRPGNDPDRRPTPGAVTPGLCTPARADDEVWLPPPLRIPLAEQQCSLIDVHHPDGAVTALVLAKCVLTPDAPEPVRAYALSTAGRRRFPADSTVDQWLEEPQFDAYVAVGRTAAERAIDLLRPPAPDQITAADDHPS